jgi:hypothetical protein
LECAWGRVCALPERRSAPPFVRVSLLFGSLFCLSFGDLRISRATVCRLCVVGKEVEEGVSCCRGPLVLLLLLKVLPLLV